MTAPALLVDTSVAIALMVADHPAHDLVHERIGPFELGLAGHAAFETYAVLTRLPAPARRPAATAAGLIASNFPTTRFLPTQEATNLLTRLPDLGITGGATYDALVAAAARHHAARLVTLDERALPTYRAIEVDLEILSSG